MEMKGALTLPKFSPEELFQEQVEIEMARRRELKLEKCCSCGNIFKAESWYEPASCPWCHASRVD